MEFLFPKFFSDFFFVLVAIRASGEKAEEEEKLSRWLYLLCHWHFPACASKSNQYRSHWAVLFIITIAEKSLIDFQWKIKAMWPQNSRYDPLRKNDCSPTTISPSHI